MAPSFVFIETDGVIFKPGAVELTRRNAGPAVACDYFYGTVVELVHADGTTENVWSPDNPWTGQTETWRTWIDVRLDAAIAQMRLEKALGRPVCFHAGGWLVHDWFEPYECREAADYTARRIAAAFPGEDQPIDLLYLDHEGNSSAGQIAALLFNLSKLAKMSVNFNFGPLTEMWWGENQRRQAFRTWGAADQWYDAGEDPERVKARTRDLRTWPAGRAPVLPVCALKHDWSRKIDKALQYQITEDLIADAHAAGVRRYVFASYMLFDRTGTQESYWNRPAMGPGNALEYLDRVCAQLAELDRRAINGG